MSRLRDDDTPQPPAWSADRDGEGLAVSTTSVATGVAILTARGVLTTRTRARLRDAAHGSSPRFRGCWCWTSHSSPRWTATASAPWADPPASAGSVARHELPMRARRPSRSTRGPGNRPCRPRPAGVAGASLVFAGSSDETAHPRDAGVDRRAQRRREARAGLLPWPEGWGARLAPGIGHMITTTKRRNSHGQGVTGHEGRDPGG